MRLEQERDEEQNAGGKVKKTKPKPKTVHQVWRGSVSYLFSSLMASRILMRLSSPNT